MIRIFPDMRYEYELAYRNIRQFGEELFHDNPHFPETTAEECALESRDCHDSQFTGWTNRQRWQRWDVLRSGLFNRWELPF